MATKTFNDICVEYAHQLGKGLPLTAPEMCNAVIMYLNAQITEMQSITSALQTAVTEAESSATEAINKAEDVSETVNALPKVPAPTTSDNGKVIGVQSGAYALVEQSGGEAPDNMVTTNTEQVITKYKQFIVNDHNPVVQFADGTGNFTDIYASRISMNDFAILTSGFRKGSNSFTLPTKTGTIALTSDIPSYTEISDVVYTPEEGAEISYGNNKINLPIIAGDNVIIDADDINRHIRVGLSKVLVYDKTNVVDFNTFKITDNSGNNIIGGGSDASNTLSLGSRAHALNINSASRPTFNGAQNELAFKSEVPNLDNYGRIIHITYGTTLGRGVAVHDTAVASPYTKYAYDKIETYGNLDVLQYTLNIPNKNGTLAITDDIPDLDNYTGTVHIVQGTAGSGIAVHDTVNASPYTKYGYDKIETYGNSNVLKYTLNIPNKNGTIATLDDITPSSDSKYFTRVIFHNTDEDTQYILFSCVTNTNLSSNTSYANVVSLLNELGATTADTALPCTGKTVTGGIVVGVYTDGTNIIVFDTDNSTEELTMSSEIKFISK